MTPRLEAAGRKWPEPAITGHAAAQGIAKASAHSYDDRQFFSICF